VRLLCDVVARNGNLLIGVGPDAAGVVPEVQAAPLRGLGGWLRVNGTAIRGSRPWFDGPGIDRDPSVRYVVAEGSVHALVDARAGTEVHLPGLRPGSFETAHLLATGGALEVRGDAGEVSVLLPDRRPAEPVHAVRLGPGARAI
jgi:alpha-L-fucosidase